MVSKTHTKYIQSLQHKKFRDEYGLFIAEGPKLVTELLESREFKCRELFALTAWLQEHQAGLMKLTDAAITAVEDFELEKLSGLVTPHTLLAVFEQRPKSSDLVVKGKISLLLDTIQDPGNLGTIIRIADWFGIDTVICSYGCADIYNPKVVQSTMGSLARVNIAYTDPEAWLQQHTGIPSYAAALNGKNMRAISGIKEAIIVIGNEGNGISGAILNLVNERITIPKTGKAESLNAAVATGIILSHLL